MIDLHLHTTASDGWSSPAGLVHELVAAGVTTCAVTDHDTTAALATAAAAARAAGVRFVPGIEITAVDDGRDVHMLGYFIDASHPVLDAFLARQREDRRRRLHEMAARLEALGVPVRLEALDPGAHQPSGKALGRPMLAAALVAAGHASSIADAFDRYLGEGRPAFVARTGRSPSAVVQLIADAGGLSSLAHPGRLGHDEFIAPLTGAGLTAIEAYHVDHDPADVRHYLDLAARFELLVTGGSDYHGAASGRVSGLGRVGLPETEFRRLAARAGWTDGS